MSKTQTRVRFAPSPTGELHIGNARTALFNWLWARKTNGRFILRIEDTDRERSLKKWEDAILHDLSWLGLHWDEGPDSGGEFGPYRQSERLAIYNDYIQQLISRGQAYPCYCTPDELTQRRREQLAQKQAPKYDGRCRRLTEKKRSALKARGVKPSLRFRIKGEKLGFEDLIWGSRGVELNTFGDFVIQRSDGWPTYNFTAVIDDALMDITHVIRGEDHLSNTPKQLLLYQALGLTPPRFGHLPLILDKNRKPLSKRNWYSSVNNYQKQGYLPQALVNYLALLGWSPGQESEIVEPAELIHKFSLDDIGRSPAIFDIKKAAWINTQYIRKLEISKLTELCLPHLKQDDRFKNTLAEANRDWLEQVIEAVRPDLNTLKDVAKHAAVYLYDSIEPVLKAEQLTLDPKAREVIKLLAEKLDKIDCLSQENFNRLLQEIKTKTGAKGRQLHMPIRLALTGNAHGPELVELLPILGKQRCRQRLQQTMSWLQETVKIA
jgi:glutamyl-tRNA synthetase